jgi:hypothetical protein
MQGKDASTDLVPELLQHGDPLVAPAAMHHKAWGFVDGDESVILIDDFQGGSIFGRVWFLRFLGNVVYPSSLMHSGRDGEEVSAQLRGFQDTKGVGQILEG